MVGEKGGFTAQRAERAKKLDWRHARSAKLSRGSLEGIGTVINCIGIVCQYD